MQRFFGNDTRTRITILDDDFPGVLSFENTQINTTKSSERIEVKILRTEGSDGKISCFVKTEPFG